jgi:hypothetical protein
MLGRFAFIILNNVPLICCPRFLNPYHGFLFNLLTLDKIHAIIILKVTLFYVYLLPFWFRLFLFLEHYYSILISCFDVCLRWYLKDNLSQLGKDNPNQVPVG